MKKRETETQRRKETEKHKHTQRQTDVERDRIEIRKKMFCHRIGSLTLGLLPLYSSGARKASILLFLQILPDKGLLSL